MAEETKPGAEAMLLSTTVNSPEAKSTDKDGTPIIDLKKRVTVYAGNKAPFHKEGEAVEIHPAQLEHFESLSFSTSKPSQKAKTDKA